MPDLSHLLSPVTLKNTRIPNRVAIPPMGTGLSNPGGEVSEALLAYMKRQAASGAGLIISEITAVHPSGMVSPREVAAFDDRFLPGLEKLAEVMHSTGGIAAMQLHHAGRESAYLLKKGTAIGPSAVPSLVFGQAPNEMTVTQIEEVIDAFGNAALRAKQAGFDAVEVHGAHGYLLTQFLSALSNKRTDRYGGSFADRARFIIEVIEDIRRKVGDAFPVILRISAEEYIKNGYTVEDVAAILPAVVAAGADAIHASIGTHGSPGGITSAAPEHPTGFNVPNAARLKEAGGVPVIAVGRFNDPRAADGVIARGEADLVAFGRQQLCDPDYLQKAIEGRYEDIRICISCNQGCIEREMFEGGSVRCAINPETGQELDYPRTPAAKGCNVWVIGAGPAGLIAAQEANRLGHRVSLFEKEDQAGGNLLYACKAPHKEIYGDWIQWLINQVQKSGVAVQTGTQVTEAMLNEGKPDAVILATGGRKIVPAIPGLEQTNVFDAWQILGETVAPGKKAIVVGGGLIGMETAAFLSARNCAVTLIEQLPKSPVPKFTSHGYSLHKLLRQAECAFRFGVRLVRIDAEGAVLERDGETEVLQDFDQIVLAVGMKPRDDLKEMLSRTGTRYFIVGDALEVRRIMEATEEGAKAAWAL